MSFKRKGRVPTLGESAQVFEGDKLKANDINGASSGLDRLAIRPGTGYRISQTVNGTTLQITPPKKSFGWEAFQHGNGNLYIVPGLVWGSGIGQMPKHTKYGTQDFSQKFFTAKPVMVGIAGSNILATDEINTLLESKSPARGIIVPLLPGTYYIEYSSWDGGGNNTTLGVAKTLAGTQQFILKHKTLESPPTADQNIAIVCFVDADKKIYQGVEGDIWLNQPSALPPFGISILRGAEGEYRVKVAFGTVNSTEAKYKDYGTFGQVGDTGMTGLGTSPGIQPGVWSVFLEVKYDESVDAYPSEKPVITLVKTEELPAATSEKVTILIGKIVVTQEGQAPNTTIKTTINQNVSGSLWVERFVVGDASPVYWATKV